MNIDNHCFNGRIWAPRVVRRMTNESARVTQVTFADGSIWKPGSQFLRGYAASGERLAKSIVQTSPSGGPSDESVSSATASGTYRLKTEFTGPAKCLDVVNDGYNNRLTMATCGNYSGQTWSIQANGTAGYWRLQSEFTGPGKCLDIANDGRNNRLIMDACADVTGQKWKISGPRMAGAAW